jgi:hypothetical protein
MMSWKMSDSQRELTAKVLGDEWVALESLSERVGSIAPEGKTNSPGDDQVTPRP